MQYARSVPPPQTHNRRVINALIPTALPNGVHPRKQMSATGQPLARIPASSSSLYSLPSKETHGTHYRNRRIMRTKYVLKAACWMILSIAAFYLLTALALWNFYSMGTMINGGPYTLTQARSLVLQMALVTTTLAFAGVVCAQVVTRSASARKAAFVSALAAGSILFSYTILNVAWRGSWQPYSNSAQFLPPWSDLNSHFFYEYNWLNYLIFITPAAMILSGCISLWLRRRLAPSRVRATNSM
jgi:hypothetical protein